MIFETNAIYWAAPEIDLPRVNLITPVDIVSLRSLEQVFQKIRVSGTKHGDFAIFATVITPESVATVDYLVAQTVHHGSEADIVPADLVATDPDQYVTPEMAWNLSIIDPDELVQFNIAPSTLDYVRDNY